MLSYFPDAAPEAVILLWASPMATTGDHTQAIDPVIIMTTVAPQNTETATETGLQSVVPGTVLKMASGAPGLTVMPRQAGPRAEGKL